MKFPHSLKFFEIPDHVRRPAGLFGADCKLGALEEFRFQLLPAQRLAGMTGRRRRRGDTQRVVYVLSRQTFALCESPCCWIGLASVLSCSEVKEARYSMRLVSSSGPGLKQGTGATGCAIIERFLPLIPQPLIRRARSGHRQAMIRHHAGGGM